MNFVIQSEGNMNFEYTDTDTNENKNENANKSKLNSLYIFQTNLKFRDFIERIE